MFRRKNTRSFIIVFFIVAVVSTVMCGAAFATSGDSGSDAEENQKKSAYEKALEAFGDAAKYSFIDPERSTISRAKATHLLEMAGNEGDERAMYCLGILYEDAPGLASKMAALRWYSKYLAKAGSNPEVEANIERLKAISGELAKISAGG